MCLFGSRNKKALDTNVAGISFKNPAGLKQSPTIRQLRECRTFGAGFVTLTPPSEDVLNWVLALQDYRKKTVLAINVATDLSRSFSLVYLQPCLPGLLAEMRRGNDRQIPAGTPLYRRRAALRRALAGRPEQYP